jgi:hypothetical protein
LCVNRSISFQNMTFFWVVALCSRDSSPWWWRQQAPLQLW